MFSIKTKTLTRPKDKQLERIQVPGKSSRNKRTTYIQCLEGPEMTNYMKRFQREI